MSAFIEWLKWQIARKEMETLERYRRNAAEVEKWHCVQAPDVAEAVRWVRQYAEYRDDPLDPPSGMGISQLRIRIMQLRAELGIK